jgi:hypothetical protein
MFDKEWLLVIILVVLNCNLVTMTIFSLAYIRWLFINVKFITFDLSNKEKDKSPLQSYRN